MAYSKTLWKDRIVEFASRFIKSGESSNEVTLFPSPGTITDDGTDISATLMNKIEQGIADAHDAIDNDAWKLPVRVATTANITLSSTQTIDGISLAVGNRVLVKNQTTASQNGIYLVSSGAWTRATDANTNAKVNSGLSVRVEQGTVNSGTVWYISTANPITLGSTSITFSSVVKGTQLVSNVASGTAPLIVTSPTVVPNLNADKVDGIDFRTTSGYLEMNDGTGWKPVGGIKSVQRGSINVTSATVDVTISPVNLAKSYVLVNSKGVVSSTTDGFAAAIVSAQLVSSTKINLGISPLSNGGMGQAEWQVIEFY